MNFDNFPVISFVNGRTLRTYRGVTEDITTPPPPPSVERVLAQVAHGHLDAYGVLNHPDGNDQVQAAEILQRLYDVKCEGGRFHPDDDFEEILNAVCDDLQKEFPDVD